MGENVGSEINGKSRLFSRLQVARPRLLLRDPDSHKAESRLVVRALPTGGSHAQSDDGQVKRAIWQNS